MGWLKRNLWKIGIVIVGMLLLLVLMVWVPVSAADTHEGASGMVTAQATPTEDATVNALNKEKLTGEVAGQQRTWDNWLWSNAAVILSSFLSTLVVVTGVLFGFWQWRVGRKDTQNKESVDRRAAQDKELEDRKAERERRAEERFQKAVEGLSGEREEARIGAAILLRTFLRPGYEEFYTQTFDLAVANLRLPRTPDAPEDPTTSLPLTILCQALIVVFKEAFRLARDINSDNKKAKEAIQSLDATGIQLDHAYLNEADLDQVWLPHASLQNADLKGASLSRANLFKANLSGASLTGANLSGANLRGAKLFKAWFSRANLSEANLRETDLSGANLSGADLSGADLSGADLRQTQIFMAQFFGANLRGANLRETQLIGAKLGKTQLNTVDLSGVDLSAANLREANLIQAKFIQAKLGGADLREANLREVDLREAQLSGANFRETNLRGADLSRAQLYGADFSGANLKLARLIQAQLIRADLSGADLREANLSEANLQDALSLKGTDLRRAEGLTQEQRAICKAKGAIIDEDPKTSSPPSIVSPTPSERSPDAQLLSAPPVQGSLPSPDTDGSSVVASQQDSES